MAHYSHSHTDRPDRYERAGRRHGHMGLILSGIALAMLAALAWVWTQGSNVESPLPQSQLAAKAQPAPATQPAPVAVAAASVAPAPVTVAPAVAQAAPVAQTTPAVAQDTSAAPATADNALMPPSDAVAAAGDTRAAH